mmetsp:Transcript_26639/g.49768  ORF Transcript_26639/g.49768 Transcript_26639/m.49768 type:complete len:132 (-) Transcript_26639:496-891(-)
MTSPSSCCNMEPSPAAEWTFLTFSAYHGNIDFCKHLVQDHKASVVEVEASEEGWGDGWDVLMAAVNGFVRPREHLSLVSFLVEECRWDVNATNKRGETVLFQASPPESYPPRCRSLSAGLWYMYGLHQPAH